MEERRINVRRKALFRHALDCITSDWRHLGEPRKRSPDRMLFAATNGAEVLVHLASVTRGQAFKAGEFAVYFTVIVSKGPLFERMSLLGLLTASEQSEGRVFRTNSLNLPDTDGHYPLRLSSDPEKVAVQIAAGLKTYAHPFVERVIRVAGDLAQLVVAYPNRFTKPFGTVAAVASRNGKPADLKALWEATEGKTAIWDRPSKDEFKTLLDAVKALK